MDLGSGTLCENSLESVFVQSKVLDRLKGEKSRLGFMDV